MSQQRLNPFTARAQRGQFLDQVEAGEVQRVSKVVVGHGSIVAPLGVSMPVNGSGTSLENALHLLESWHQDAKTAAGLNEGQVCAYIGNGRGGEYDPSQWTAARKSGNLPFGRMLAGLPDVYLRTFAIGLALHCGLSVSHADIADVALERTAVAFEAAAEAFRHMRRSA